MENFDDLKNLWNKQSRVDTRATASDLIQRAEVAMKRLRTKQRSTITVLATLTLVLVAYFIWAGAHKFNSLTIGLGIMIGAVIIRILFECVSVIKLKKIKTDSSMIEFSNNMSRFYRWRRRINILLVPIIYGAYIAGFTLLLPPFKEHFSRGMYLYILISGYGSLTILALFIAWQIKKETMILNVLKARL